MTLIITLVAAVIATVLRFKNPAFGERNQLGVLALMYWGASIMWCVDWIAELSASVPFGELITAEAGSETLLGLSVVALGLVAWVIFRAVRIRAAKRA
jgi:hypothetical protein